MVLVLGIDEAGRGPVIGNLVLSGVIIDENNISEFKQMGVTDSKLLSKEIREQLFTQITKISENHTIERSPKELNHLMQTKTLNQIEIMMTIEIIKTLKPDKVIIDCPIKNTLVYKNQILNSLDFDVDIIAENKADLNYEIVGAASIIAKVTRDTGIEKLKSKIGIDFGSGYTSDPLTINFMQKHFDKYPDIIRTHWETYKRLINQKHQKTLFGYENRS